MLVFHGTSRVAADRIMAALDRGELGFDFPLFASTNKETARGYAKAATTVEIADSGDCRAVVFHLRIPAEALEPDPAGDPGSYVMRDAEIGGKVEALAHFKVEPGPFDGHIALLKGFGRAALRQPRRPGELALVDQQLADADKAVRFPYSFAESVPEPELLIERVRVENTDPDSWAHDESHWRGVANIGLALLRAGSGGDPAVVFLFALLHDSQRRSEGADSDHGQRAANLAARLREDLRIDADRFRLLETALVNHDRGQVSTEPTVGTCWDADRLALVRFSRRPSGSYLSTPQAREVIDVADYLIGETTWREVIDGYRTL